MRSPSGRAGLLILALLVPLAGVAGYWIARSTGGGAARGEAPAPQQLWTCGMHPQVLEEKPGTCPICHMALTPVQTSPVPTAGGADRPAQIYIDPVVVQNMGLRTAPVTSGGTLASSVSAVGYLEIDQSRIRDVTLKVGGWIDRLYAETAGMPVESGEILFDLYSPDLAVAIEEYANAVAAWRDAPLSLESSGGSGAADSSAHTISPHGYQGLMEAARARLQRWDVSPRDANEALARLGPRLTVPFRSPISGHILEKNVVEGVAVEPGTVLFRIADLSTLWLDARLYESAVGSVRVGQTVRAEIAARPGEWRTGKVVFVSPLVDPESRATTVRMEFPNPGHELRPGMFARVDLDLPADEGSGLSIPREAIIDTGRRQVVFVTRGAGHFEPVEVRMGRVSDDGMAAILSGLSPSDTVVVSGQFLLDSESRLQEAIRKMMDAKAAPPAPGHGAH